MFRPLLLPVSVALLLRASLNGSSIKRALPKLVDNAACLLARSHSTSSMDLLSTSATSSSPQEGDTMNQPTFLYTASQVADNEKRAAELRGIEMWPLMQKAGKAAYDVAVTSFFPLQGKLMVLAGKGNNGGDGYIVAGLALRDGHDVIVKQIGDPTSLKGDAAKARDLYLEQGGRIDVIEEDFRVDDDVGLIVDALFGIGLSRPIAKGPFTAVIEAANASRKPILAVDIPSGLSANTGAIMGTCVKATATVTFIGCKQGLFTGKAAEMVGKLHWAKLGVAESFEKLVPSNVMLARYNVLGPRLLPPRPRDAHKGMFGRLLVVGGGVGMPGAVRMTGEAAQRVGAGLVRVVTHESNIFAVGAGRPELMISTWIPASNHNHDQDVFEWGEVLALGPGLGQTEWARTLFNRALRELKPMVIDADGLNLLAEMDSSQVPENPQRVLTPHPGEAGRLLGMSSKEIEADRFAAVRSLQSKYGGVVLLKGAGTLVCGPDQSVQVVSAGNPGMASGGMGDTLTGIIAGLMGQKLTPFEATTLGACIHAEAGDMSARQNGERGLLATDLLPFVRHLVNPSHPNHS